MDYFIIILLLFISYLLGSIPSGYLLGKYIKKIDLTKTGSKNTGATNTTRVLGVRLGIIALIFDLIKGIIIMSILLIFQLNQYYIVGGFNILPFYGVIAVAGHVFSIFLNFKGGKAVATSGGVLLFLTPYLGILTLAVFVLVVFITKYISLASILSATTVSVTALLLNLFKVNNFVTLTVTKDGGMPLTYAICYIFLTIIIVIRHHENIKRLINKNENKFSFKKSN